MERKLQLASQVVNFSKTEAKLKNWTVMIVQAGNSLGTVLSVP